LPSGRTVTPKQGRYWAFSQETFEKARAEGRAYFGKNGDRLPIIKRYADKVREGVAPRTWLTAADVGTNQSAKRDHLRKLLSNLTSFDTPKPEGLIARFIHIASNPGDLVLDSFLGSGTTAAVAHKMGRRWIGIEMGEHAVTHCKPRLDKVIAGEQGGISEAVGWSGGGGYRFYRLGEPVFDSDGAIAADIRFPTLAAHVWFSETGTPYAGNGSSPLLGVHEGTAYALLYNGILGDRSVSGGNVLTSALLDRLRADANGWSGPMVIYGEASRLGAARLKDQGVTFKQTPYDVRAR
jgi:adenine-specific DNA-methyltransferase